MKKIIILGFAHSGTTILRQIMARCDNVYTEKRNERKNITLKMIKKAKEQDKEYILIKQPGGIFARNIIEEGGYKDYIKILLVRNPYFVISAINVSPYLARGGTIIPSCSIGQLGLYMDVWRSIKGMDNTYHIKYEDMFDDDYKNLKNMFNKIGLEYDDKIFDNVKYRSKDYDEVVKKVSGDPELKYWKLNQPFRNMNIPNKLKSLKEVQKKEIDDFKVVKLLNYNYKN